MHVKAALMVSVVGAMVLTGCASNTPAPAVVTVTAPPSVSVVVFNPTTSGKELAARLATRAEPKNAKDKVTGFECKNFANLKVGTHTDCQMLVNGVKRGLLVTFTQREGHYVTASQKLTW